MQASCSQLLCDNERYPVFAGATRRRRRLLPGHDDGVPLESTTEMFDYLVHVHLRDAVRGSVQAALGQGELDVAWVLEHAARAGHDAPVCIEYFGGFDADFMSTLALKEAIERFGT